MGVAKTQAGTPATAGEGFGKTIKVVGQHVVFVAACLLAWELLAGVIGEMWISRPTLVVQRWLEWVLSGFLFYHLQFTMYALVTGFALGAAGGLLLGFI